mmetsp:Transcript_11127/g.30287  ORF Transcript_11127/g.30287 Transcript_11127/m.30287 type:complete len:104 (+) Transcript_11127:147-458(+)
MKTRRYAAPRQASVGKPHSQVPSKKTQHWQVRKRRPGNKKEEDGEEEEEEEDSKGGYAEALVASQHPPLRLRDEAAHAAGAPRLRPWAPPQPGSRELLMEDTS